MKINIDKQKLKTVGQAAGAVCKLMGYALVGACCLSGTRMQNMISFDTGSASYSDTVRAIMSCDMWDNDKNKAVNMLPKDGTPDFYSAVISVVRSNMWSKNKVNAIENMCRTK